MLLHSATTSNIFGNIYCDILDGFSIPSGIYRQLPQTNPQPLPFTSFSINLFFNHITISTYVVWGCWQRHSI